MQQLVILTGLSGAGKTVVLRTLEDMESIKQQSIHVKVVFLNAEPQVLIQRFSETRRRHPLSTEQHKHSLTEAVNLESALMNDIKQISDLVIDTSKQSALQLKQHIWQLMSMPSDQVSVILKSFAFKRGVPFDADFVFDARCLNNPYWDKSLRHLTGKDEAIKAFFAEDEWANDFIKDLCVFSKKWIKRYEANDRSYITIAVGCTGGQHRSVYLVESLANYLGSKGIAALVLHREMDPA